MKFSQVTTSEEIKTNLRRMIRQGRMPHALLISGSAESGAMQLALATAQYLNCRERTDEDACGVCPECYKMQSMQHPDVHYIYPVNTSKEAVSTGRSDEKPTSEQFLHLWRDFIEENSANITEQEWYLSLDIENKQGNINKSEANELVRKMGFKAFEGGWKIVVIWLPERLHDTAANTLLKLIEEPPPKTLFILVSVDPDNIIATIRSRTQHIKLPGLSTRTHDADQTDAFVSLMRLCYSSKYAELFDWADQQSSMGREVQKQFCAAGISLVRSCYMTGIGMDTLIESMDNPGHAKFMTNFAPYVNEITVEPFVKEFELLLLHLRRNGNPRILFTHFALSISKIVANARANIAAGK